MEHIVETIWRIGHGRSLTLGSESLIMAIVNVTPDSFSDGGRHATTQSAFDHAMRCVGEGAAIIDIGGESTRPGAADVSAGEEQDRVLPVIERLAREGNVVVSIDTYRAETARLAIAAGAHIVNDVHGLQREPEIASMVAEASAGVCIMHTGRGREKLADVIADQKIFFQHSLAIAETAGIKRDAIVLDPGFGFAKDTEAENVELMARFAELRDLGLPLLVGTSRKRFLGTLTGRETAERDVATSATSALLRIEGASVFRVHNVAVNRDALRVADAILSARSRLT